MLRILLGCQVAAPLMVLDPPTLKRVSVVSVEHRPRELTDLHMGWGRMFEPEEQPERLLIRCKLKDSEAVIAIDLEQRVIESPTWDYLTGQSHMGSGAIGVFLFGMPGIILSLPLLLLVGLAKSLLKRVTGMDHHTWVLWSKLKGQIPDEHLDAAHQAFLNRCNGIEQALNER